MHLSRVLILEENTAYARMLADMLRCIGADNIVVETDDRAALVMARKLNPQLILIDYKNERIDGIAFVKALRRSDFACRKAPVIMIKAEVTPAQLSEARNAGVHEMLRKPFAWQDLMSRLENVLFKTRDWVEVASYIGPDRRRFNTGDYKGAKKRKSEADGSQRVAVEEAVRLLKASLELFDDDGEAMMRTVMQQMAVMVPAARSIKEPRFLAAVTAIIGDLKQHVLTKERLATQVELMIKALGMNKSSGNQWAHDLFAKGMADQETDRLAAQRLSEDVALSSVSNDSAA
ncbi:response regulator [Asticcacaulis sp. AC402]|uniref:response regulator n=1 Tax=Asticcacaulis sp. AC402 TaxID=1282361 RepID=UPI0004050B56|nr:response regulator [Asticcacaulis sp. AC402]